MTLLYGKTHTKQQQNAVLFINRDYLFSVSRRNNLLKKKPAFYVDHKMPHEKCVTTSLNIENISVCFNIEIDQHQTEQQQ